MGTTLQNDWKLAWFHAFYSHLTTLSAGENDRIILVSARYFKAEANTPS
jgi:hypothetical protein